jgi:EPS-associated MarR family transcriptional regulator
MHKEYEELKVLMRLTSSKSQHDMAKDMDVAVGKVNYIIKALAQKGFIKIGNFINEENKTRYRYLLTEDGIKQKVDRMRKFIEIKKEEYELLRRELEKYEES